MADLIAEYVSPGHPDRLADGIANGIVKCAVALDSDALVGVEVAVHTDKVFVDGRVAAGRGECAVKREQIERIVREVYSAAGYGEKWSPRPAELKVIQDVCLEPLFDDERAIRCLSDDQNIVIGHAAFGPATDWLPPAHFLATFIGGRFAAWRTSSDAAQILGPDFKVMVHLAEERVGAERRFVWRRLTFSVQHARGVGYSRLYELVGSQVREILEAAEARGLKGVANLPNSRFHLNGAGDFVQGGPHGDNGLSGKKLVVDFYGPDVPIGGGAISGKDPHKVDVCGARRARELAVALAEKRKAESVTVRLAWSPGDAAPALREAWECDSLGLRHDIPASDLPPEDWFSIAASVPSPAQNHRSSQQWIC